MIQRTMQTESAQETVKLGERLGKRLRPGDVVALVGELGAGKTTITRGIAQGLGVEADIHSPTFTLIHEHPGTIPLYHVDLYRIDRPEEAEDIGIEEYIHGDGVTIIEWAEKIMPLLPEDALRIELRMTGDDMREIAFETASAPLSAVVGKLDADTGD